MNADDCNGRSYMSGNGDSSTEREFFAGLRGPTVSTPNSQHSSPSRSLSANSIKVELYSDEEAGGAPPSERRGRERGRERDEGWKEEEEKGEAAEEGTAEPGVGTRAQTGSGYGEMASPESGVGAREQAGSGYDDMASPESVSLGPIRLPNGKLKCDVCGMICIGPNVLMVHKRSHTGERPFQCNQCGASFTQKGNLLRHIKLHSGEKPFKCPFCNYACRRRDALTGHLRTHSVSSPTVGKPYKCSYCGRSYKQQSTLEEHRERCHSYLQSLDHQPAHSTQTAQGEENRNMELVSDPLLQPSTDKMTFIDRLANSITKRKRSTPQKFLGEKHMRLNLPDAPYELTTSPKKERGDMLGAEHGTLGRLGGRYLHGQRVGVGEGGEEAEPSRPLRLPAAHATTCLSEFPPIIGSVYSSHMAPSLGQRLNCVSASGGGVGVGLAGLPGREAGEGHEDAPASRSHATVAAVESPSNGCLDSTDTESMAEEQCGVVGGGQGGSHHNTPLRGLRDRYSSPSYAKDIDVESARERERERDRVWERERERERERDPGLAIPQTSSLAMTPVGAKEGSPRSPPSSSSLPCREALQVVDGEGRSVRSFRCEHCRILFLDHVMFTIHMGCHGFRQPFECNICGHRSQDRYEFSSHIVRGEHQVG
ncbi:zinc finger protein Eos isoform X2 [Clupea harengus]|uniref:Zinc finger protein Eos isoform X2 n=1 Tax=Clupea harengus TaxID=7950 RepID=A0A6P8FCW4_CLUHA|nr:zinc finger protein Eos isoform X2 [Clupea harengus]